MRFRNSSERTDFLVAGGGPSGATLAALLAGHGERVLLVERCAEPEHKVCGEFLSYETLAYLRNLSIDPWALGAQPIRRLRLAADTLIAEAELPFEAASLSRKTMDAALLRHARDCGAHVVVGRQVEYLAKDSDGWRMTLDDNTCLRGTQAALATGKHDLRGHARGNGTQAGLVAFKIHLKLAAAQARCIAETVEVVLFSGGYLGMQPTEDEHANLCLLIRGDMLRGVGGGWPRVVEHLKASSRFLRERLYGAQECFPRALAISHIPYGYIRRGTFPGLWALGDQTAVIPSFSGDGMAIAMHSAYCAAALHAAGGNTSAFDRQMQRTHHSQVAWSTVISRLMVESPKLADLFRYCPFLLRRLALSSRIAEEHLLCDSPNTRSTS